ncbi:DoxX family membrane protein [Catalinimonas niigatensis]|uniref:DoxX family membrane protein n=1 Tax=Catalinimonas niigatensis TaxID=1397264 RepID=UPI0026651187|nr:DoxX family membrane protein [Catalinimonas niigatensis]WPP51428.1 DoxX family membrane protein [Catalinimonas niigatensis]
METAIIVAGTPVVRIMLGLIMVSVPSYAFLNKDFPPKQPEKAQRLMHSFRESGYLLYFIQSTELLMGLLLLSGYFTPLAALILMPVSINILLFHLFLAPPIGAGILIFLMNVLLLWACRADYMALLHP